MWSHSKDGIMQHTFMLFWLRKTSVSVKTSSLSFHVLFYLCLSSRDLFIFPLLLLISCYLYFNTFVFYVVSDIRLAHHMETERPDVWIRKYNSEEVSRKITTHDNEDILASPSLIYHVLGFLNVTSVFPETFSLSMVTVILFIKDEQKW